jgi:hypothetical protein
MVAWRDGMMADWMGSSTVVLLVAWKVSMKAVKKAV